MKDFIDSVIYIVKEFAITLGISFALAAVWVLIKYLFLGGL